MMDNAFRVAFLLCTVASAFGAFWLGISGEPGAGVTMAGLAAIFAAFTFLTKFKRFKGLGFEGELWEQEMEQAAELRRGLKDLAEQLGESVAWQMGFWSGGPFQERLAVIERTITILLNIGVSQVNIDELTRRWHNVVMTRLAEPIAHRTRGELKDYMFNEVHKGIMAERKQRMEERPGTQEPTSREAAHCWKSTSP
jgi:hypothetical protein